jgi:hypothetical protein
MMIGFYAIENYIMPTKKQAPAVKAAAKKTPAKKAPVKKAAEKKIVAKKAPVAKNPTKAEIEKEIKAAAKLADKKQPKAKDEAPARVKKPTRAAAKKKQPASVETSQSIEEQTKAFLAQGGQVEAVQIGMSGQQNLTGPKHITLGNKSQQS